MAVIIRDFVKWYKYVNENLAGKCILVYYLKEMLIYFIKKLLK